jgi:hypothetical protein
VSLTFSAYSAEGCRELAALLREVAGIVEVEVRECFEEPKDE